VTLYEERHLSLISLPLYQVEKAERGEVLNAMLSEKPVFKYRQLSILLKPRNETLKKLAF